MNSKDSFLTRMPLRLRLVAIMAALLVVALLVTTLVTLTLLKRSLIAQVDENLHRAITSLEERPWYPEALPADLVSDYHVRILSADGSSYADVPSTTGAGTTPDVPALTIDRVREIAGQPRTVDSVAGNEKWRMVFLTGRADTGAEVAVAVALPLNPVTATLAQMQLFTLLVGLGVTFLAAAGGYVAVQRSLQGLRDIETTAAAVASGDLSMRAPLAPETTEVGRLGVSFNSMVANLESAFATQAASEARMRRFVSDASHELRTPLASIRGYGELYRMGAVAEADLPGTMSRIENEAIRMGSLVNDLLSLARLDEGRDMQFTPVDLTSIANDAVGDLGALDPTRPAALVATGPVPVSGNADRLRQVVTNLIGNVVQHTPAGTAVEVHTRVEGEFAYLEVIDHGPGIPADEGSRVFERFYRPDTSRARTCGGGSGLGLAIVATIIQAHGGQVSHRPTPGGGATMGVRLPRQAADQSGSDPPRSNNRKNSM